MNFRGHTCGKHSTTGGSRLWEVDAARGIAIIMMVFSNALFDLSLFAGCSWCYAGFWVVFARATAGLFVLLVGVSLTLSWSRGPGNANAGKYAKRGARILLYGVVITGVTFVLFPQGVILFGILHLIGVSIILAYPFLRKRAAALAAGIVLILTGLLIESMTVPFPWLIWLGLTYPGFTTVDYTPLLPWFGVALVGVFMGNWLFPGGRRKVKLREAHSILARTLAALGRMSLMVYFIHQPIIIGLLFAVGIVNNLL